MSGSKRTSRGSKKPIEQYEHTDKKRRNNPPVGLVTPQTDEGGARKTYACDPHLDSQLQWAGKAEHTSFEVDTVSLPVHERIDPRPIIAAVRRNGDGQPENEPRMPTQMSLFEQPAEKPEVVGSSPFAGSIASIT